jgi:hypothetical protein
VTLAAWLEPRWPAAEDSLTPSSSGTRPAEQHGPLAATIWNPLAARRAHMMPFSEVPSAGLVWRSSPGGAPRRGWGFRGRFAARPMGPAPDRPGGGTVSYWITAPWGRYPGAGQILVAARPSVRQQIAGRRPGTGPVRGWPDRHGLARGVAQGRASRIPHQGSGPAGRSAGVPTLSTRSRRHPPASAQWLAL